LTFLVGSLLAYFISGAVEVGYLLPFAAGNSIYIAAADLLPEIARETRARDKVETTTAFVLGLGSALGRCPGRMTFGSSISAEPRPPTHDRSHGPTRQAPVRP
jgi:hypothetical protein